MSLSETAEAYSGSFMHKHAIELALRLIENRRYEGVVLRPVNGYVICLRSENWKTDRKRTQKKPEPGYIEAVLNLSCDDLG